MNQSEYDAIFEMIEERVEKPKEKLSARLTFTSTEKEFDAITKISKELDIPKGVLVRAGLKTAIEHPSLMLANLPTYISPEQLEELKAAFKGGDARRQWPENLFSDSMLINIEGEISSSQYDALMEVVNTVLTDRERKVVFLYYRDGLSMRETGRQYNGVTVERIRQILAKALRKLHRRKDFVVNGYSKWINEQANLLLESVYGEVEKKIADEEKALTERANALNPPIEELDLSVRAFNCLSRSGIDRVKDLNGFGIESFVKIRNLGRRSAREINERLKYLGYDLYSILTTDHVYETGEISYTREEFERMLQVK